MPWGPSRISFKKLSTATHTIGDTSTPPTGGIAFLVGARTGSVGFTATDQGSLPPSICVWHNNNNLRVAHYQSPHQLRSCEGDRGKRRDEAQYMAGVKGAWQGLRSHT